jgi:DNA topoisomerase-1
MRTLRVTATTALLLSFAWMLHMKRATTAVALRVGGCRRYHAASSSATAAASTATAASCPAGVRSARLNKYRPFPAVAMSHSAVFLRSPYSAITTTTVAATATALPAQKKSGEPFTVPSPASPSSSSLRNQPYCLVIVESPSKCATIEKILADYAQAQDLPYSFVVTSCLGHVRNLPSKDSRPKTSTKESQEKQTKVSPSKFPYSIAGIDLDHNYTPTYEIIPGKEKVVKDLTKLAKGAEKVLLATDPDREGEAMAWHLQQVLGETLAYERISFSEITPSAVQRAIAHPVSINPGLVQAQETRRILDRLAGFTVSPLLWKKIAPGLSAGRVQSVGMALVVQRERERLRFQPTQYNSIEANFVQGNLTAQLRAIDDVPVALAGKDFASQGRTLADASSHKLHLHEDNVQHYVQLFSDSETEWKVVQVKATKRQQQPPQPYRTSTLQQDANRRLGLSVEQCMRVAQQLYENGLISYMRTDASYISEDAEHSLQRSVESTYGRDMYEKRNALPSKHKKDSKFAQEAHEAIRPAIQPDGTFLAPDSLDMPEGTKSLYRIIYQRTLASRMPNLITNLTQVAIEGTNKDTVGTFRVSGSVVLSPGYTAAYNTMENDDNDPSNAELPELVEGQILESTSVEAISHETQPPPRYTEASFVKELEALGVGRPSTYAGIVKVLRERAYVGSPSQSQNVQQRKNISGPAISAHRAAGGNEFTGSAKGSLVPSLPAFTVCHLLEKHCPTYIDPEFTSTMETRLDQIANSDDSSELERLRYLDEFYAGEDGLASTVKKIEETVTDENLRSVNLPALNSDSQDMDDKPDISLLVGPWGPYIQRSSANGEVLKAPLPSSMAADLSIITRKNLESILTTKEAGGYLIGVHPDDGRCIRLKTGRFGAYLQRGEDGESGTTTHSLPKGLPLSGVGADQLNDTEIPDDYPPNMPIVTYEEAVGYASLPKIVGELEDNPITAAIGPYGPYLRYKSTYANLAAGCSILDIDSETAKALIDDALTSGAQRKPRGTIAELGEMEGAMVRIKSGRFGPYINWKKVNAKLPDNYSTENLPSLEESWFAICEKAGKARSGESTIELPPAPKRPAASAWLLFCSEARKKIADKKLPLGESSKLLSQMWAEIDDDERARFDREAAAKKDKYEEEKAKWKKECQRILAEAGDDSRPAKDGGSSSSVESTPKRPKSSYLLFCEEHRPQVAARLQTLGEVSKELARLWRETNDKSKYEQMAAVEKTRYEEAKGGLTKTVNTSKKGTGTKHSKKKDKIPPRPPSAYLLFCKEFRPSVLDDDGNKLPLGETTKRLASMWKSSDSKIREKFEQLALEEREKVGQRDVQ